ncbi:RraA family protein [Agrobacterium vitis]|uniref:Putative 4-hydroxy-4-methyl-2-oxoglutarate aldolase n=1 Tax=Agrobacterium vitis TaxID=373 RepID=A0A125P2Z7_AGRVI|nr:RraA family protein [Agrobacterium vitis]KAA3506506.1 RraA family protein [Agrobacterium vitis]KAA3520974.1 RraA family protein [Agrobacterium vitis]MCF1479800.1 RraA family protein [Agrobacterium vitis]MUO80826.1 RraA family protein [Agrobacterium vitis]MUO94734.1 RraA family protein [Agrobacterium vitis]
MLGFKVCKRKETVTREWVKKFAQLPVANLSDVMSRMTAGGAPLRPFYTGARMVGPAITVKARPGDNLMVHKALDIAEPGDVVVVDAGGDLTNAIIGELMVAHAAQRGLGGIVIFGAIRDSAEIQAGSFPVFAAGVTHRGPYKDGPGEVNVPIAINGMVIQPGDLICGDPDGLLSVPADLVGEVYTAASKKHEAETRQMENIKLGKNDRTWVDATLARLGCTIEL